MSSVTAMGGKILNGASALQVLLAEILLVEAAPVAAFQHFAVVASVILAVFVMPVAGDAPGGITPVTVKISEFCPFRENGLRATPLLVVKFPEASITPLVTMVVVPAWVGHLELLEEDAAQVHFPEVSGLGNKSEILIPETETEPAFDTVTSKLAVSPA